MLVRLCEVMLEVQFDNFSYEYGVLH